MTALDVIEGRARWSCETMDNLTWLKSLPDKCCDLVLTSPPYEAARTYSIGFNLKGQDWVDWVVERFMECLRVCKGLVAWVVEGQTRKFRWSATPALLMADLHRKGVHLRKPPIFKRVGIPGSGGPDWLRNDYEFIICATNGGKLPWSDNTAMGHEPKWAPGGEMSNRLGDGTRVNQWGHSLDSGATIVSDDGTVRSKGKRPSHKFMSMTSRGIDGKRKIAGGRKGTATSGIRNGDAETIPGHYDPPVLANPGNVIECLVGGGVMGSHLTHENEAPFPESLVEFFVRSFAPENGIVCDPHSGSGTTIAVAGKFGRKGIACDLRESQTQLTIKRMQEKKEQAGLFASLLYGDPS